MEPVFKQGGCHQSRVEGMWISGRMIGKMGHPGFSESGSRCFTGGRRRDGRPFLLSVIGYRGEATSNIFKSGCKSAMEPPIRGNCDPPPRETRMIGAQPCVAALGNRDLWTSAFRPPTSSYQSFSSTRALSRSISCCWRRTKSYSALIAASAIPSASTVAMCSSSLPRPNAA